jgi:GT2 family glycosyltransferase
MRWFDYRTERPVDALVGCFIMARRAAVEDFGQLDESFFMYGEDIDWCWRCRRAGWEVAFVPEGRSIHYGGSSSANAPLRFSVELQRATVQWWTKHRGPVACLCLKACLFAQNLLRALREVVNAVVTRKWESAGKIRLQTQLSCLRHLLHSH